MALRGVLMQLYLTCFMAKYLTVMPTNCRKRIDATENVQGTHKLFNWESKFTFEMNSQANHQPALPHTLQSI